MNKKKFFMYFALAASIVILAVALTHLPEIWSGVNWVFGIISPIVVGLCLAFVLNVIMCAIEKKLLFPFERSKKKFLRRMKRPLAIILTLVVAFGFVSIIISVIYPALRESVELIIKELPGFMKRLSDSLVAFLNEHDIQIEFIEENGINWGAISEKIITWVKDNTRDILDITTGVAGNIFGTLFNFILSFILALYVLSGKEKIRDFFHNLLKAICKPAAVSGVEKVAKLTYSSFAKFITGQITEAVILGLLCLIGMLIMGIPMASVVSVIVGVTALIPIFGAWIGGALGMFFILLVDPVKALVFIIFLLILQQLEGNIIYPKVVGESIGLPGILVLCAVSVGGGVGGIAGILFSVPLTSVAYYLVKEYIEKKRDERNKLVTEMISDGGHIEEVGELLNIEHPEVLFDDEADDSNKCTEAKSAELSEDADKNADTDTPDSECDGAAKHKWKIKLPSMKRKKK